VYYLDAFIFLIVLVLSLGMVLLIKKLPLKSISELFGVADIIVLTVVTLLLSFQVSTYMLIGAIFCSFCYLVIAKKQRKKDARIPFLLMFLPWTFVALLMQ
jgi:Ca2+/Na+ antiporter